MKILCLLLAAALNLIPAPRKCDVTGGTYAPDGALTYSITADKSVAQDGVDALSTYLDACTAPAFAKAPDAGGKKSTAAVKITIGGRSVAKALKGAGRCIDEAYILNIGPKGVEIAAQSPAGAFYAIQSILQLTLDNGGKSLPCCSITDWPQYPHRGLMFDPVRHFRTKDFILKQLDAMAMLKLNRFHFHLMDSQAWRLQLDSHPELTAKCAFRNEKVCMKLKSKDDYYVDEPAGYVPGTLWDEKGCYGGYYSKENIREIIAYAAARHITVLPEVEMPGHSRELRHVHPEMFCPNAISLASVCPGKEETFTFFQEVLDEVMELFPCKYVHIGGDEASKSGWKQCPDCQARMKKEGLADVKELQSYMIRRIEKYVNSKGHNIIGWEEIMEGGLTPNATVMSWLGVEAGNEAAAAGHDVIMTPTKYCYLDYYQNYPALEPEAIGGYVPLKKTYSFPMPENEHVLGIQGNLWAEYIAEDAHYEYMLYPRAYAIAEVGWTGSARGEYKDFKPRAQAMCGAFHKLGYNTFDLSREAEPDTLTVFAPVQHLAVGAKVTASQLYHKSVGHEGDLVDGKHPCSGGCVRFCADKGENPEVILDLGRAEDVHYIGGEFRKVSHTRHLPDAVAIYVSQDGRDYRKVAYLGATVKSQECTWASVNIGTVCSEKGVRYIKFVITPMPGSRYVGVTEFFVN